MSKDLPRISLLSDKDIKEVNDLANRLGISLNPQRLSRYQMLDRFFVVGRECKIRGHGKEYDAVITDAGNTTHAWFYVGCELRTLWQWRYNPTHIRTCSQIYTEIIPEPYCNSLSNLTYEMMRSSKYSKERKEIIDERKRWSIEFNDAEWPFDKFQYL